MTTFSTSPSAPTPKPFLKWAGGKTQLLPTLIPRLPSTFNNYFEPFLGGGALFFSLLPERAMLSDNNTELMVTYIVIRDQLAQLVTRLHQYKSNHSKAFYSTIRSLDRDESWQQASALDIAARFIYLNRTCFNGLHRVNKSGQFNVPIGSYKNPTVCDEALLTVVSEQLNKPGVQLAVGSVFNTDYLAQSGDFVYLDPPYIPLKPDSFTAYGKDIFGMAEQEQLVTLVDSLTAKGVKCMVSQSDCPTSVALWAGYEMTSVEAKRSINSKGGDRKGCSELVITNY